MSEGWIPSPKSQQELVLPRHLGTDVGDQDTLHPTAPREVGEPPRVDQGLAVLAHGDAG